MNEDIWDDNIVIWVDGVTPGAGAGFDVNTILVDTNAAVITTGPSGNVVVEN